MAKRSWFVHDAAVKEYDGSLGALRLQLTVAEWEQVVRETHEHLIFVQVMRKYAFPILEEDWTRDEKRLESMLRRATRNMNRLDPLFVAAQAAQFEQFERALIAKAQESAAEVKALAAALHGLTSGFERTSVFDL